MSAKNILLIIPFWGQPGHVGNIRAKRFVRWLHQLGYKITIVKAGSRQKTNHCFWGREITVRDPLRLYSDVEFDGSTITHRRKSNRIRRKLSYLIFFPDPTVIWALAVSKNKAVLEIAADADFVLSTSPPESSHVSGWIISRKTGVPHIVDLRDGWLDEPLKPILSHSYIRRKIEGRLEESIFKSSKCIFVTSAIWRDMLTDRLHGLDGKVTILTNAYPLHHFSFIKQPADRNHLLLSHIGRFTESKLSRKPQIFLDPFLKYSAKNKKYKCTLEFAGNLSNYEKTLMARYEKLFAKSGWKISTPGFISRNLLFQYIESIDGLLLLENTMAALPAKLFEYIPSYKPILVFAKKNSATYNLCKNIPQAFLADLELNEIENCINNFLDSISSCNIKFSIPCNYSDESVKNIFYETIKTNTE